MRSAGAARTIGGWAAGLFFLAWPGGSALAAPAEAWSSTPTPLSLVRSSADLRRSHLLLSPSPDWQERASFSFGYSQPLSLTLEYSAVKAGPSGKFYLAGGRVLGGRVEFALLVGPERRPLVPGEQGASMQTALFPGRIIEYWRWPDGLRLERTYYQPLDIPALGIRFRLAHPRADAVSGVRIEARWHHPEILEFPDERDDDLWADPREALLLLRDYVLREESWVACGWGSPGGLITGGETGSEAAGADFMVALESPAQDLPSGQAFLSTLWLTWGPDQESVAQQVRQLQKQPGYSQWLAKLEDQVSRGVSFSCNDPALTELFLAHKAWMPWMVRRSANGQPALVNLRDSQSLRPQQVLAGLESWLALRQHQAIREYLDYWLDQRAETPDLAYTLCLAARYYDLTRDHNWLLENAARVESLAEYFADMDSDQNGLPEYQLPPEIQTELLGPFARQDPLVFRELEFFDFALAGCEGMRETAALLWLTRDPELTAKAQQFSRQALLGADALQAAYWQSKLGQEGFYAFARVAGTATCLPLCGASAINLLRSPLGAAPARQKVWQDLWNNRRWRSGSERYVSLRAQATWLNPRVPVVDYQATHETLRQGLRRPETAEQALARLQAYARGLMDDVHQLGWTGKAGEQAYLDPASLNFIFLVYSGLAGLEPESQGMRVSVPAYPQELAVVLRSLPYRGTLLDVEVLGPGGGQGAIWVNGKPFVSGAFLPEKELGKGRVKIRIVRSNP